MFRLTRARRALLTALATAATSALALLEVVVFPGLVFSPVYLPLVGAAGWWLGRVAAVVVALVSSATWFHAQVLLAGADDTLVVLWNGFGRFAEMGVVGLLTAVARRGRDRLLALARTDPVTELPNGRAFLEQLERESARARRGNRPLCLAYADLDNFKRLNDLHGHAAGNELLRRVGSTFREALRTADLPARIGGDEFAVLFDHADADQAELIGRRLVERIQALGADYPGSMLGASVGIVCLTHPPGPEAVLNLADTAMYRAKRAGKGQVVVSRIDNRPVRPEWQRRGPPTPHAPIAGTDRPA